MSHSDLLIVSKEEEGMRLDLFLKKRLPDFSRTYFQELISNHLVLVNQELVKKRTLIEEGDEIEVEFTFTEESSLEPQEMELDILYEDDHLLAINKAVGVVVHPGCKNPSRTLVNGLLYHVKELTAEGNLRPGIIHRLDKDTTGVILCAKTREAQEKMVAQFAARTVEKSYLAITLGKPQGDEIKTLIGRHPTKRQQMAVVLEKGKEAITKFQIVAKQEELSLVLLHPKTGRTHQLRVHMQFLHTPILGDPVYGKESANASYNIYTQMLHAYILKFIHPLTGAPIEIKAPPPQLMRSLLDKYFPSHILF